MTRWRPVEPFATGHRYADGQAPKDHHPGSWGPLTTHRCVELGGRWRVSVRSTERRKDGWAFCVVEMADFPAWISYFHNQKTQTRVQSHRSGDAIAGQLAQAFELYNWGSAA